MKIRLAKKAGFCMGVRRAVDMVLDLQRSSSDLPIVTYGPLIHNPQTLALLQSRGICQVDSIEQIEGGTVVIRAHGISPQERSQLEARGVGIIDATCPRVSRVQAVIRKRASKGIFCVIVGDEDHPEVRGLIGFAAAGGVAVNSADRKLIESLVPSDREVCVVAQTTQDMKTFEDVVSILEEHCRGVEVFNTICNSTRKRQEEVMRIADHSDLIVVVGGRGSGNTRRLEQVARARGVKTLHVETDDEIPPAVFSGVRSVGVTAGASTPNWQIRRVIDTLKEIGIRGHGGLLSRMRRVFDVTVMTYCWAAAGGGGLAATSLVLQGQPVTWQPLVLAMLFVFSMHLLTRVQDRSGGLRFNTPEIAEFYTRHRTVLTVLGVISSIAAIALSARISPATCVLLVLMQLLGGLYSAALIHQNKITGASSGRFTDVPGSKTPLVALGWATAAAVLPALGSAHPVSIPALSVSFLFAASMVFWRTAFSDLLDIQGDRIVGRATIPILIGVRNTQRLLRVLLWCIGILVAVSWLLGLVAPAVVWLVPTIAVFALMHVVYSRSVLVDRLAFEGLADGNLIAAGIISIAVVGF